MNTFNKEERLCSRKLLDLLFKNGSSFLLYPYRVTYLFAPVECDFPTQVVINVAKKRYKSSVDRNLIKRRIREAYRLQKNLELYTQLPGSAGLLVLSLQFVGKKIYEYSFFEKKMDAVLKKLVATIHAHEVKKTDGDR